MRKRYQRIGTSTKNVLEGYPAIYGQYALLKAINYMYLKGEKVSIELMIITDNKLKTKFENSNMYSTTTKVKEVS